MGQLAAGLLQGQGERSVRENTCPAKLQVLVQINDGHLEASVEALGVSREEELSGA